MAAGHGVEHVQRFAATDFPAADSLRPLPQSCMLKEVLHGQPARTFDVCLPLLETEDVLFAELVQPELPLGFQDAGALAFGAQHPGDSGQRRLPATSRTCYQDVEASL